MIYNIAICDDNNEFVAMEKELTNDFFVAKGDSCVFKEYSSGVSLLKDENELLLFDFILLDVEMEGINGIETARRIREISNVTIVIVSSFINYSIYGYEVNAIRYVLKDDNFKLNLYACLEIIIKERIKKVASIEIIGAYGIKYIPIHRIEYVESQNHTLFFHLDDGKTYDSRMNLKDAYKELIKYDFCRTFKSYLVNLNHVDEINYRYCKVNNKEIPISRDYYPDVHRRYSFYKGRRL